MNTVLRKIVTGILVASLALAGLPLSSAYAAGPNDLSTPQATPQAERGNARLQRAFVKQAKILHKAEKLYKQSEQGFPKFQRLIDKAKERGLDVAQVQAAFDAFKAALPKARPFYEQAKSIAETHNGFDANGNVTDATAARETVKGIHEALAQFKDAMGGTSKALHEAVRTFRTANPRHTPYPTGTMTPSSN